MGDYRVCIARQDAATFMAERLGQYVEVLVIDRQTEVWTSAGPQRLRIEPDMVKLRTARQKLTTLNTDKLHFECIDVSALPTARNQGFDQVLGLLIHSKSESYLLVPLPSEPGETPATNGLFEPSEQNIELSLFSRLRLTLAFCASRVAAQLR